MVNLAKSPFCLFTQNEKDHLCGSKPQLSFFHGKGEFKECPGCFSNVITMNGDWAFKVKKNTNILKKAIRITILLFIK